MHSKIINWGIIGAGKIASKFASDLNNLSHTKLYAIASRTLEKAEDFATQFGAEKAYGNYQDLAMDPNVDAIYVATPHNFHKAHTLLCLKHNKPVLCEKPFAINSEDVNEMIEASKELDTLLMEALWTAFLPHFQYVLNLLNKKHFGEVLKVEADFGFYSPYDENSRLFNMSLGGGSLLDIGIYPVFMALSSIGQPKAIEANAKFFPSGADSECTMLFQYDKANAVLNSTLLKETKTEAIISCEHGTIKINGRFHEPSSVVLIDKKGHKELKTFGSPTIGYSYEIEHFNELIRAGKTESNVMTFARSRQLISTLDEIRKRIGLQYS